MDYAEELSRAEALLDREDYEHALHHACGALSVQPNAPAALDVIDRLSEELDITGLLADEPFLGAHAARARVLAGRGEFDEAIGIVSALMRDYPERGFEHWLAEWAPGLSGVSLDVHAAHAALASALRIGLGRLRLLPTEREVVLPLASFGRAIVQTTEGREHGALHSAVSGVVRRTGDFKAALELADRAIALDELELGGIARGLALRGLGRPDEAAEAFEAARAVAGDDMLRVERARALGEARRCDEALSELEAGASDDAEIRATFLWLEGCRDGDPEALSLTLDRIRRRAVHGWIPTPTDASSQAILGVPDGSSVTRMGVSSLEAPSVRLALAAAFAGGDLDTVDYGFGDVPEPDPRAPWKQPVYVEPWRREGDLCRPAYDPPSDSVADAVRSLAASSTPPNLVEWWDHAEPLAAALGAAAHDGLLGALVHPPLLDEVPNRELPAAMFYAQVAATMLLVRLPEKARWAKSRRRALLLSLIRGPQDWLTSAAVLVSVEVALHEPAAFDEIRRELADLAFALPTFGHATFARPLFEAAHRLPLFSQEAIDTLDAWLSALDEDVAPVDQGSTDPASEDDRAWVLWTAAGVTLLVLAAVLIFLSSGDAAP
ncbi:MAG: hypothetical protein AB8I08_35490 [Sandaracinaceae bacterium]